MDDKYDSPVLQAWADIDGATWRTVAHYGSEVEAIFIENYFTENQMLELARAVIAAHEAKVKT